MIRLGSLTFVLICSAFGTHAQIELNSYLMEKLIINEILPAVQIPLPYNMTMHLSAIKSYEENKNGRLEAKIEISFCLPLTGTLQDCNPALHCNVTVSEIADIYCHNIDVTKGLNSKAEILHFQAASQIQDPYKHEVNKKLKKITQARRSNIQLEDEPEDSPETDVKSCRRTNSGDVTYLDTSKIMSFDSDSYIKYLVYVALKKSQYGKKYKVDVVYDIKHKKNRLIVKVIAVKITKPCLQRNCRIKATVVPGKRLKIVTRCGRIKNTC